jgi:hypothetical protein
MLRIKIRNPEWVKKQDPDPTTRIIFPRAWKQIFWVKIPVLKLFDADPGWKKIGSGMENIRIRDPG